VVGHYLDEDGYRSTWYDQENDDGLLKTFTATVPQVQGYLFFLVESYYYKMMPMSCTENVVPKATITIYREGSLEHTETYFDQFHRPVMFYNYGSATFTINV
jgi:hypothetical protein